MPTELRMSMRLRLEQDQEVQYASGGHPADGVAAHPDVPLPHQRLAVTGWELVLVDERGYTWGRVVEPDIEAIEAEREEQRRVAEETNAAAERDRTERLHAQIKEWFPAHRPDKDQIDRFNPPPWFAIRAATPILQAHGRHVGRDRPAAWAAIRVLARELVERDPR